MNALEIDGIVVRFGGTVSLDGVELTVDGGTWGLIGPNGAGKTTFFNVLSGFAKPSAGTLHAYGHDLLSMAPHARARWGVRRTFQTEQAIRDLTVMDNVVLGYEHGAGGRGTARQAASEAIAFAGLAGRERERVDLLDAYSRRLVELARALVGSPRLVLFDEPAAGLPDAETAELCALIKRIPDSFDATVILVDHDMSLVSGCCEKVAVLDYGRVIASGPTADVLSDPRVLSAYLGENEGVA